MRRSPSESTETFPAFAHTASEAVVCTGRRGPCTVGQLLDDVGRLAGRLPDGELVVVCRDRYRFLVALLAVWSRGGRVALPPNAQRGTLEAITGGDLGRVLHDGPAAAPGAADGVELGREGLDLRALLADACGPAPTAAPVLRADDVVATLYTSGTTGTHQAATKTAAQLYREAELLARLFGLDATTRVVSTVPPHHIYGLLFSVLVPLVTGGGFVRETPLHAEAVAHALRAHAASVLVSVPAHLRSFEALEPLGDAAPALIFSSSAPLPTVTAAMLHERHGIEVTEVLGSTETGGIAWRRALREPLWTVFDGLHVDVDPDGRLLLDSPFLAPDVVRPMPCGDRIRPAALDAWGRQRFDYRGRVDDVVKVAGKRVTIGEVTRRLLSIEGVEDAAVQAIDVATGHGRALRAAAVAPGHSSRSLRLALRRWFDPVVLPRRILIVDSLPRDARGKLPRRALDALFAPRGPRLALGQVSLAADGTGASLTIDIPAGLALFEGHFPGRPILPGVAQLEHLVLPAVHQAWPALTRPAQVSRLKFRAPVQPGDRLTLELRRRETTCVDFVLRSDDGMTIHSDGRLAYHGRDDGA